METIREVAIEIIVDTNKRTKAERLVQGDHETNLQFLARIVAVLAELTDLS